MMMHLGSSHCGSSFVRLDNDSLAFYVMYWQQQYLMQQPHQLNYYYQAPKQPQYQMGTHQYYQATQHALQKSVQLTLPADACPGRTYEFEAEGRTLSFQVPQGYGPGMQITVSY